MIKRLLALLITGALLVVSCTDPNENGGGSTLPPEIEDLAQIEELQNLVKRIQESIQEYKGVQFDLSEYVSDLQQKMEKLTEASPELKKQAEALEEKYSSMESQVKSINETATKNGSDVKKWASDLYATKESFTQLSNTVSSISTSIKSMTGKLDGVDATIADVSTKLDAAIKSISGVLSDINKLDVRIDKLEKEVEALLSAVQSIVVVPSYSDGSVKVSDANNNKICFDVYPQAAAEKLAAVGASCVSLEAVETSTKASEKESIKITVSEVGFDGTYFYVIADGSALSQDIKDGVKNANASLTITDGKIVRSSDYFQLVYTTVKNAINLTINDIKDFSVVYSGTTTIFKESEYEDVYHCLIYSSNPSADLHMKQNGGYPSGTDTLKLKVNNDGTYVYDVKKTGKLVRPNTQYRIRPFVYKNGEYFYGDESSFTTPEIFKAFTTTTSADMLDAKESINIEIGFATEGYYCKYNAFRYGTSPESTPNHLSGTVNPDGSISVELENLTPNTTYYYKEEIDIYDSEDNYIGYVRSDIMSFTTGEAMASPDFVDLGLSVKWAKCNLGATSLTDIARDYSWNSISSLVLETGTKIPDYTEWQELFNPENCTIEAKTYNSVRGLKIKSKKEGYTNNCIFLPYNNYYYDSLFWLPEEYDENTEHGCAVYIYNYQLNTDHGPKDVVLSLRLVKNVE